MSRSRAGKLTLGSTGSNRICILLVRPSGTTNASSLFAGTRRMPRGTTPLVAGLPAGDRSAAADTASRAHGRVPPASTADAGPPHPVRAGARGGCSPGDAAPAPTIPARSTRTDPRLLVPVVAGNPGCYTGPPDPCGSRDDRVARALGETGSPSRTDVRSGAPGSARLRAPDARG